MKDQCVCITGSTHGIGFGIATVVGMWFALQADIAEAKELPKPPKPDVTRMEFDMKDKNIRLTIENTQEDVEEIKEERVMFRIKITHETFEEMIERYKAGKFVNA